jgi:hypothetical protein
LIRFWQESAPCGAAALRAQVVIAAGLRRRGRIQRADFQPGLLLADSPGISVGIVRHVFDLLAQAGAEDLLNRALP